MLINGSTGIYPYKDGIYDSVLIRDNTGKYGLEKTRILTYFTQCGL